MSQDKTTGLLKAAAIFTTWAEGELKRIKAQGISRDSVSKFLTDALVRLQGLKESLNVAESALNDAFLNAKIALEDAPWLNTSGDRIAYVEVEIKGFDQPIFATI